MIIETVVSHVIAGLLGWGVLEGGRVGLSTIRRRRPLCRLYPFSKSRRVWIVLSEVAANEPGEYFNRASPIDGVYSFDDLSDYLRGIGLSRREYDTRFSSDLVAALPLNTGDDLILIGGYENNAISRIMNAKYRDRRNFYIENNKIIEQGRKQRIWGINLDDNNRITRDHCLITKIRNPFYSSSGGTQSWVVAFEGVRQFGTLGAVRYWNERLIRQLGPIKANDEIEAVMSVTVKYVGQSIQVENSGIEALYINGAFRK